jgi:two-component system response regulator
MTPQDVQILLVEDDPKDAKLTIHALREENLANNVQVARDGEEALDYLFSQGEFAGRRIDHLPQLVLLDLKLPKVDGLEVLRTVKADPRTKTIPIVVLTSSREESDLVESYRLGVNAYVQKPVEFDSFRQAVKQLGLFWLVVNEAPPARASCPQTDTKKWKQ